MLFGNGLACVAACAERWDNLVALVVNPDFFNAAFEFVGGILIWLHTARAWKDQEIKGVSPWPFIFFWSWGIYNLWYYSHIGQPISGMIAFMPCLANSAYLFSLWLFRGPFNYDKRSHRARWFFIRHGNRIIDFFGNAALEVADLPTPRAHTLGKLQKRFCWKCCKTQPHDLDNHCMECDRINKGD